MILERLQYGFGELYWRTKPRGVIWFHILTSRGQWYVNCGGHDLYDDLRLKRCLRMESEHPKPVIWYLSCLFSLSSYFDLQRSFISEGPRPPGSSEVKKGSQNRFGTPKTCDLIPPMTHFHWFHIFTFKGHWYLRSRPLGSSEVKRGLRIESEHQKNLWFDTLYDLFSLISYFDLRRSLIFGGHDLQDHLRSNRGFRMEWGHKKNLWFDTSLDQIYIDFIFWPF